MKLKLRDFSHLILNSVLPDAHLLNSPLIRKARNYSSSFSITILSYVPIFVGLYILEIAYSWAFSPLEDKISCHQPKIFSIMIWNVLSFFKTFWKAGKISQHFNYQLAWKILLLKHVFIIIDFIQIHIKIQHFS